MNSSVGPSGCLDGMATGEYGLLDVIKLERFPNLDNFAKRPGRSALIIDDMHLADLSKNSTATAAATHAPRY
eukprot:COSAG01_NODE_1734_length_9366_cov_4.124636_8_plen_72_part_00